MFVILPVGHEEMQVRRLPWVTIAIAALCVALQVWSSVKEAQLTARYVTLLRVTEVAERAPETPAPETPAPEEPGSPDAPAGTDDRPGGDLDAQMAMVQRQMATLEAQRDALRHELPAYRFGYLPSSRNPLRMVSYAFLHGGWMHLLGNLLFLWLVGLNLEDRWGRWRFLGFYLVGAVVAAVAYRLWHPAGNVPLIGASGAIAAAMGAFSLCYATTKIRFFYAYWLFLRPRWGTFYAAAWVALPLWFVEQLVMSFLEARGAGGVAYSAHVGGFVMGAATALVLRQTGLDTRFVQEAEDAVTTFREEPEFVDAQLASDRGDTGAALRSLDTLFARVPDHHEGRLLALRVALAARDRERAGMHLADALESLSRRHDYAAVTALYQEARTQLPDLAVDARALHAVLLAARRHDAPLAVVDATQQALRHHPTHAMVPGALWATADALERLGRHDDAVKALRRIVASFPGDAFAERAQERLATSKP